MPWDILQGFDVLAKEQQLSLFRLVRYAIIECSKKTTSCNIDKMFWVAGGFEVGSGKLNPIIGAVRKQPHRPHNMLVLENMELSVIRQLTMLPDKPVPLRGCLSLSQCWNAGEWAGRAGGWEGGRAGWWEGGSDKI